MVFISMGGIILAAAYMLWMLQRVVLGEASTEAAKVLPDISNREMATLIPLAILVFCIGLYPGPLLEMMDASVTHLIESSVN
jgi:NADH-quinone oxidoreductase subunit M